MQALIYGFARLGKTGELDKKNIQWTQVMAWELGPRGSCVGIRVVVACVGKGSIWPRITQTNGRQMINEASGTVSATLLEQPKQGGEKTQLGHNLG